MSERHWSPLTFADPAGHTGVLIALWLAPEAADALAVEGGEPAASLHLTLAMLAQPAAELTDLQLARLLTTVDDLAAWTAPLSGEITGMGRFYAGDGSDGQDVVFAIPSVRGLAQLRTRICDELGYAGLPVKTERDFVPHVTLAYVEPGAPSPVEAVPTIPLAFGAITVAVGDRMTTVPLRGWTDGAMTCADAAVLGEGGRFFTELREFVEPPEWLPLLPAPGEYLHPTWGMIALPPERIERLVASVNEGIYQDSIPVDAEHELEVSGALGWFSRARVNPDGSADVKVEWNDRGRQLLEDDRFRYVSPTFWPVWTDPATQQEHEDVVTGLALCTRPFFKSLSVDRALVASETGGTRTLSLVRHAGEPVRFVAKEKAPRASKESDMLSDKIITPQQFTELEGRYTALEQRFTDLSSKHDDLLQKFTASETARAAAETKAAEAEARVKALEDDKRRQRFRELVIGGGKLDKDKPQFFSAKPGEEGIAYHVAMLESFGDDEAKIQAYVEEERAKARALMAATVNRQEFGSDAPGDGGSSATDKLTSLARTRATEKGVSFSEAMAQLEKEQPQLFAEYQAEAAKARGR